MTEVKMPLGRFLRRRRAKLVTGRPARAQRFRSRLPLRGVEELGASGAARARRWRVALAGFALALAALAPAHGAVVLNEIHYNPPEGAQLEFIELLSTGATPEPLGGYELTEGVHYVVPADFVLEPGGLVVIAQNPEELASRFNLPREKVLGPFTGSLDNGGEEVALSSPTGVVVDQVRYDDDAPWDRAADGTGSGLERLCATVDAGNPANWSAAGGSDPTPLAPSRGAACPPPGLPPPSVAITEINYHPLGDKDAREELVELRNNTAAAISLKGYAFTSGIDYVFNEDTVVAPGGFVVVCRDVDTLRALHGLTNAVGNFTGQLSNSGERITLVDPAGNYVDSVRYGDSGDWPVAADGLGYSLEKIVPTALSDDPASWKEAGVGDLSVWRHVDISGVATSSKILVYLDGEGEFLLDNVVLVDTAAPGANLLPNSTFDTGIDPWVAKGNHADTTWEPQGGADGGGALRIVAAGRGTGAPNGLALDILPELSRSGPTYKLSFDFKYITGTQGLQARISGATTTRGVFWQFGAGAILSPGKENTSNADHLPPFIGQVSRFPREPGSVDKTWITARVRSGTAPVTVDLEYRVNVATAEPTLVSLLDDGLHQDGAAGDGVHGAELPAQPHNTIVLFTLAARDARETETIFPRTKDPTGYLGYYVNDLKPGSPFPTYTLLLNHTSAVAPRSLLSGLNCTTYRAASVAFQGDLFYNVGLRQRGQSVCGSTKPYLKLRFQRGRDFDQPNGTRAHKLNLQSLWTDKSLVREGLAWEVFEDLGMPACTEDFVRIHVNGKYYGLYGAVEHPDARFLERNNLNPDGNLYKATASTEEATGTYEKKTNEDGDMSDLRTFLQTMHATPRPQLSTFFEQNVDRDRVVDYQLGQTLTNNSDYPHKNHYLYHDTESNRWMPLTWDMDLTFGKIWDGTYGGVLHDKMHTPGNNPWYTTSVDGGLGNHLLDKFFAQGGDFHRRAYLVRLLDALNEKYTEAFYDERLAYLSDLLLDEQAEDLAAWGRSAATADDRTAPKEFLPNLERVRAHVKARRAYLLNYLKTRSRLTEHDRLKITEVNYNPPGSGEDLEFLELWNPDEREIDVSGWTVEGIGYAFPAGTRVGPGEILVLARDPVAFAGRYGAGIRALGPYPGALDNSGEILRLKDAGPGYPATVDFLRFGNDAPWPRGGDGLGFSIELTLVAPNRDNDLGIYWKRSNQAGGSPGKILGVSADLPVFTRGEVNGDGRINLTDALVILRYLFQGGDAPGCLQSADVGGDEQVKLDDAVVLLQYLFQDIGTPIPLPGPGQCAPANPALCAGSNCRL